MEKRVSWKEWREELLQAYETLSLLILQKTPHSELLFYRALFLWTLWPSSVCLYEDYQFWVNLLDLVEIYREMLPKQRGQRLPSSFRMAKMANRQAAMGKLTRHKIHFGGF
jgi:hypothetical protein